MRIHQAGTSVLAALVFVAIFVLLISSYKIVSPGEFKGQTASVAGVFDDATEQVQLPERCTAGEVHTVDLSNGSAKIGMHRCYVENPADPSRPQNGPDIAKAACSYAAPDACVIRYCPPSSMVTEDGMCIRTQVCDQAFPSTCLRGGMQNASQPDQAANILAARLLSDKGATHAQAQGAGAPRPLAALLSDSGSEAVSTVIEATAAAVSPDGDTIEIEQVADVVRAANDISSDAQPVAQISCQPKSAEPGMKVGIAFGCINSTLSASEGFSNEGRLWGVAEGSIPDTANSGVFTYTLSCSHGAKTDSASCAVDVRKTFVILTSRNSSTQNANLAWISRGVTSCVFSSPDAELQAALSTATQHESGVAVVARPSTSTIVSVECVSASGKKVRAEATVLSRQ